MKLLIVIVNYRTAGLTIDCLRSLQDQITADVRVTVTDNASGDDSVERIQAAAKAHQWNRWLTIMPLGQNGGFAWGNNAAIRPALAAADPPEYVLLLNPDTIVRPGAIAALLDFMDAHPSAGIAGSRLENPDGSPQHSAFRFPSIFSELDGGLRLGMVTRLLSRWKIAPDVPVKASAADWVSGASLMIRRAVCDDIGLLDDRYFMYFEEVDFCRRARRAGWDCWYVPASRVVHLVAQSSGMNDENASLRRRPAYWFESRRRYFLRNHNAVYALAADFAWAGGFALWRLRRRLTGRPDHDPPRYLADFIHHSVWTRGCKI